MNEPWSSQSFTMPLFFNFPFFSNLFFCFLEETLNRRIELSELTKMCIVQAATSKRHKTVSVTSFDIFWLHVFFYWSFFCRKLRFSPHENDKLSWLVCNTNLIFAWIKIDSIKCQKIVFNVFEDWFLTQNLSSNRFFLIWDNSCFPALLWAFFLVSIALKRLEWTWQVAGSNGNALSGASLEILIFLKWPLCVDEDKKCLPWTLR